jgi:predicted RNase H-like HicB family nuclease
LVFQIRTLPLEKLSCLLVALRALSGVTFTVETEQENDGRWIAEIPQIPGAMAYGSTRDEAIARVEALGLRVLAERIEQGESSPEISKVFTVAAA